jgi:hypothetical protein
MRVTAMLAWFDEPPALLRQAVSSAATIADEIVAVDGAYQQTPNPKPRSPQRQTEAIYRAAVKAGIRCAIVRPTDIWEGQVAKRDYMIQIASEHSDWVFPLDADWIVTGDREAIRAELEASTADEIEVQLAEPLNPKRALEDIPVHQWHRDYAGETEWVPLLYRSMPEMHCEQIHWAYTGLKDGERIGLWGGKTWWPAGEMGRLKADCLFEHRCLFRADKHILRNVTYAAVRADEVDRMAGREL